MDCHHYAADRCRSCTWLPRPYADQVAAKQATCAAALAQFPDIAWLPPVTSVESGFRNKAKMVVSGTAEHPVLGIVGPSGAVDLQDCGLHTAAVAGALPVIAAFITRADLAPYDVGSRRGELKFVLVTGSPDDRLMVRFVCRSQEPVTRIQKHLGWLLEQLPTIEVVSVNLQPEHKAVLEGPHEIVVTERAELLIEVNGIELALRPQSFFQTNTAVATELYGTARSWAAEVEPVGIWDLFCGVGGFALHLAGPGRAVVGLELGAEAVASARDSAARLGLDVRFECGDAAALAGSLGPEPDLVVVNPPRRGIGLDLARWLAQSAVPTVLYSSCNVASLAADLAAMPTLVPVRAQVFDMFPHTSHAEVLTLLERRPR